MITDPEGNILAGPLNKEEGIIYAEVDPAVIRNAMWNLDVAGHYARPDAFQLSVRTAPSPILHFNKDASSFPIDDIRDETGFSKEMTDHK